MFLVVDLVEKFWPSCQKHGFKNLFWWFKAFCHYHFASGCKYLTTAKHSQKGVIKKMYVNSSNRLKQLPENMGPKSKRKKISSALNFKLVTHFWLCLLETLEQMLTTKTGPAYKKDWPWLNTENTSKKGLLHSPTATSCVCWGH